MRIPIFLLLCFFACAPCKGNTSCSDKVQPLEVVRYDPYNAETPLRELHSEITPEPNVYVRTNFGVPELTEDHVIEIGGAVERPFKLSMEALRKMPQKTVRMTMECAGNDRYEMRPLPEGEPWNQGAVSTITWTGVKLSDVLAMAGVSADAVEVLVTGADAGKMEDAKGEVRYQRGLPIKDAMNEDTLLALSMNGKPLTPDHGAPVRLAVPGWYGMASVKWVARIDLIKKPFEGYFQKKRYVYEEKGGVRPVDRMLVKSIITSPEDGSCIKRRATITGWAWSGNGAVTRVEIGVDGGNEWYEARLGANDSANVWTPWSYTITFPYAGRFVLRTRATDATGATQPDQIEWNRLGYGNNAIKHILVDVE